MEGRGRPAVRIAAIPHPLASRRAESGSATRRADRAGAGPSPNRTGRDDRETLPPVARAIRGLGRDRRLGCGLTRRAASPYDPSSQRRLGFLAMIGCGFQIWFARRTRREGHPSHSCLLGIVRTRRPKRRRASQSEDPSLRWDDELRPIAIQRCLIFDLAPVSPDGFKRLQKPMRDAREVSAF